MNGDGFSKGTGREQHWLHAYRCLSGCYRGGLDFTHVSVVVVWCDGHSQAEGGRIRFRSWGTVSLSFYASTCNDSRFVTVHSQVESAFTLNYVKTVFVSLVYPGIEWVLSTWIQSCLAHLGNIGILSYTLVLNILTHFMCDTKTSHLASFIRKTSGISDKIFLKFKFSSKSKLTLILFKWQTTSLFLRDS